MASAREIPGLDCDGRFDRAAPRVLSVRAEEVFAHSNGVLDVRRTEPVHDMRVAIWRLRAAIEYFGPCLPAKRRRKALKRLKALADGLGRRRDCDVRIELLEGVRERLPEADRPLLDDELDRLRVEQARATVELAGLVERRRLERLRLRLRRLGEAARR